MDPNQHITHIITDQSIMDLIPTMAHGVMTGHGATRRGKATMAHTEVAQAIMDLSHRVPNG